MVVRQLAEGATRVLCRDIGTDFVYDHGGTWRLPVLGSRGSDADSQRLICVRENQSISSPGPKFKIIR